MEGTRSAILGRRRHSVTLRSPHVVWNISPLGDSALLLECGDRVDHAVNDAVHTAARWIRGQELVGCPDLVPAYVSLAVHFDPARWDVESLSARLQPLFTEVGRTTSERGRLVTIPVRYGGEAGPDLMDVSSRCGLSAAAFIERHSAPDYRVMFLGFSPGFAYLGGLDPALVVPRRSSPRRAVPPGSVGIGGTHTGVYPSVTPGGWHLIGRTGERLFDAYAASPSVLQPGDRLRFQPVDQRPDEPRTAVATSKGCAPGFAVEHPGLLSSLQDLGRPGYQHHGVAPGGALDPFSHRVSNWLVGNDAGAATLEITMVGPRLVAQRHMTIALCGATFTATVDGAPLPMWRPVSVAKSAHIVIGTPARGARAYLAVEGGFDVPQVLGSRSTALRDGFGGFSGRALRQGDELPVAEAVSGRQPSGAIRWSVEPTRRDGPVRVLPGPQWELLTPESRQALLGSAFHATPHSDRMGVRLHWPTLALSNTLECLSAGVVSGTIQLPPDGQPIVLLADRQTTGGYPRIGEVISADLNRVGQLRPGDVLRFSLCSTQEARARLQDQAQSLEDLRKAISVRLRDARRS